MRRGHRLCAVMSSLTAALLVLGFSSAVALAGSGIYQGGALKGSYFYTSTESYAEAVAPNGFVLVWAKQDGGTNTSQAGRKGEWREVRRYGIATNTNDGAGAYIVK